MPSFQCAVITGACGGLGQSLARQLLGSGAQVALVGLNHDTLKALQALAPERCRIYTPDVSNAQAIQAMAADCLHHWGAPDLVIANAGVAGGFETSDPADLAVMRRMLEINLLGVQALGLGLGTYIHELGQSKIVVGHDIRAQKRAIRKLQEARLKAERLEEEAAGLRAFVAQAQAAFGPGV